MLSVPIVSPIVVPDPPSGPSGCSGCATGPSLRLEGTGPWERVLSTQMKSARSLRIAPFGLAPMMLFTGLPPWKTVIVGIDMTW